ncbi:MAG: sensor histidine kinase [Flavisolibacter sp.]
MKLLRHKYSLHVLSWAALYFFWVMVFQRRSFAFSQTATIEFCYLLFISANFYFNIFLAIPQFLYKQRYIEYSVLFILGVLVTAVLRVPLALFMNSTFFLVGKPQPTASALFIASFLNIFIWSALLTSVKIVMDRFRVQQYVEEIKKERSKAELDFLNAQLNPHFLFNSIHSIYGHIDKNNNTARNMLLTFSEMLRYQLYDCNSETIDINRELDYIKNYVALQRARKEEDLVVNFQVDKNVKGLKVAPLLFICFVENAFKYVGITEEGENRIDISFSRLEDGLLFKCLNTKEPIPVANIEHGGIGIENTRRRLALHYPEQHSLDIQENKEYYLVKLKIELDAVEMHYSG